MNSTILQVKNISKQYRLGLVGAKTINDDLKRLWYRVRGKEDPFMTVGEINDRSAVGISDYVWALKDISFDVKKGEVLGIIGKNGAGKSTLLKILSRVTGPTTGEIKTKGRIASLLEVGTGFHPELSGRENIFLNGAILGMTKSEIKLKLNEIIDFSGCERYIDTPVKRYSSGMRVRLAFAVAAFLEPDILIVDEVLAVGDAEFQKKAIGKMQDISQGQGRTVIFVSHNMSSVESLCSTGIVLNNGLITYKGLAEDAVSFYLKNRRQQTSNFLEFSEKGKGNDFASVHSIGVNIASEIISTEDDLEIDVEFTLLQETDKRIDLSMAIYNESDQLITLVGSGNQAESPIFSKTNEKQKIRLKILNPSLNEGIYNIKLRIIENRAGAPRLRLDELILFDIKATAVNNSDTYIKSKGFIKPRFTIQKVI